MSADLVIRSGTVLDGTGQEPYQGDVVVERGRIAMIGNASEVNGAREVDATGLFVAPGFIDIHSHSDFTLLVDPRAVSAIHQGVTLEVIGNCGHGCFPVGNGALARNAIYGFDADLPLTWRSAGEYFERLSGARPAVNVLSLVPNGQLRLDAVGLRNRPATREELSTMRTRLEEALADGAWGYSTGLEYATEAAAPTEEIEALCEPVAHRGAYYATHTRDRDGRAAEAVEEAIRVARSTGVRLQISHLLPRSGAEQSQRCIEAVERAREGGLDVSFDMHTRLFGFTFLSSALPAWALEDGPQALADALRNPSARERMKEFRSILSAGGDWSRIVLLDSESWPEYARLDIATIAAQRDQDPHDAVFDLLQGALGETHRLMVMIRCYSEQQQREAFQHPLCIPESDATTLAPDGPLAGAIFHGAYTWAAWFYRYMVRETKALSPAEAIARLTAAPAARIGLRDRGVLRVGAAADLAIFDPEQFAEQGTTFDPNRLAVGMRHVVVNGALTLRDGKLTGTRQGSVLIRSQST